MSCSISPFSTSCLRFSLKRIGVFSRSCDDVKNDVNPSFSNGLFITNAENKKFLWDLFCHAFFMQYALVTLSQIFIA